MEDGRRSTGVEIKATGFTHVSVNARDLEASARFYGDLFGMEEVPSPDFANPVRWFRLGDLQLHLFEGDQEAPSRYHFGVEVDDFEAVYERANELGVRFPEGYFSRLYELPEGAVQMYLLDPAGNMIEVDWPDIDTLDRSVISEEILKVPIETDEGARAALYMR